MNLCTKQRHTHRHKKQTYGYERGKTVGGRINQKYRINGYILLYKNRKATKITCIIQGIIFKIYDTHIQIIFNYISILKKENYTSI